MVNKMDKINIDNVENAFGMELHRITVDAKTVNKFPISVMREWCTTTLGKKSWFLVANPHGWNQDHLSFYFRDLNDAVAFSAYFSNDKIQ